MKVFETNQKIFALFYAYPLADRRNSEMCLILTATMFIGLGSYFCSSSIFIFQNIQISLEETLAAVFAMLGFINIIYNMIVTILLRKSLIDLMENFQKVVDKCKYMHVFTCELFILEKNILFESFSDR